MQPHSRHSHHTQHAQHTRQVQHVYDMQSHTGYSHTQDMQPYTRYAVTHKTCSHTQDMHNMPDMQSHSQRMQPHARHAVTHKNMHNAHVACYRRIVMGTACSHTQDMHNMHVAWYRWIVWARHAVTKHLRHTCCMLQMDCTGKTCSHTQDMHNMHVACYRWIVMGKTCRHIQDMHNMHVTHKTCTTCMSHTRYAQHACRMLQMDGDGTCAKWQRSACRPLSNQRMERPDIRSQALGAVPSRHSAPPRAAQIAWPGEGSCQLVHTCVSIDTEGGLADH